MNPMNAMMNPSNAMHQPTGMDFTKLKDSLMQMMMFKTAMSTGNSSNSGTSNSMFDMVYVFVIAQLFDVLFKVLPVLVQKGMKYTREYFSSNTLESLVQSAVGLEENKKKKNWRLSQFLLQFRIKKISLVKRYLILLPIIQIQIM